MAKIILANNAGFCFGVKRAVDSALESLKKYDKLYTYGEIIHNKSVVEMLEEKGAVTIETLDGIKDTNLLIRSHGVAKSVYDYCRENNVNVIDNTCPFVAKVHDIVKNAKDTVVIIGEASHPEIIGIKGWVDGECIIINNTDEAKKIDCIDDATIVVQTTFDKNKYKEIETVLKRKISNPHFFNTICNSTEIRQQEALELSKKADCVVVVGGKHSSNTKKLYDICKKNCKKAYFIENAKEITLEITENSDIIGIVTGASTPDWIIGEVLTTMSENLINNEQDCCSASAECSCDDAIKNAEGSMAETENKQIVEDDSFSVALEKSLKTIKVNEIVTGTVVQVNKDEIFINIGYKSDGIIPKNEYSADANVNICDEVKIGDTIDAQVVKLNDGEGNVLLSIKKIANRKKWLELEEKFKDLDVVYHVVGKQAVKGGVIAELDGVDIFVPASLLDTKFVKDLTKFVGQEFDVRIVEFNKTNKKIIGNRRVLLEEEAKKLKEEIWSKFAPKQEVTGVVKRITDFGAFVDIGGIDGLLHVADIAWYRIKHPSDVLKVNDEIKVLIIAMNQEKERISLGLKQLLPKPWENVATKYSEGQIVKGKVVRLLDFGAFVELEPGVDGLIHISQIALKHVENVADELKVGDEVECKIISVDPENKKISLSIKQLLRDREPKVEKTESEKPAKKEDKDEYIPEITESSVTIAEFFPDDFLDELKDE